jgi:DNA mismatch endonuclease (patch repair protein)
MLACWLGTRAKTHSRTYMDVWSESKRSEVMGLIKWRGNRATEVALLRLLRSAEIKGWRRHLPLIGRPDFAFPKSKVAVFVDGCFWHGCPKCYRRPKSNHKFWDEKRVANVARDKRVTRQLRRQGWKVIRIWQHSLKKSPDACVNRIRRALACFPKSTPALH